MKGLQLFLTCNGSNPGYKQRFVHRQRFHPSPAEWRKVLGGVDRRKGVGGGAKGHSGPPTAQALGCSMLDKCFFDSTVWNCSLCAFWFQNGN